MIRFEEIISRFEGKITAETTLGEAIQYMLRHKWNLLPVTDEGGKLIGVFTRSEMYKMILEGHELQTPIEGSIKKEAFTLRTDTPFEQVEKMVQKSPVGTGVVLQQSGEVAGLFTKTDMVLALLDSSNLLKEQFETILSHAPIGVFMTNEHSVITYCNDRLCAMSGKRLSEILQHQMTRIFPELEGLVHTRDKQEDRKFISMTFPKYKTVVFLTTYQRPDEQKGYIALFHDISEIERMAEDLQTVKNLKIMLETALENAYDGIIMTDKNGLVEMVNPPLLELFDLTREQVMGHRINDVLPTLQLSHVFETQMAEFSDFQERNGISYIVHRIPIMQDGQVIGAIGKIMFRQLHEVNKLLKKLQKVENKANFYQKQFKQSESARFSWEHIYSVDPYMEKLKRSAAKAAKGRSTILIRGESGTGKELFAHAIHNGSARCDEKFVEVNCAAIPEDLLESEFFGYEEGAFTGAKQKGKIGKFDLANGGTLFLDEVGDMSLSLQAKLLRVLQEREFYRVGGTTRIKVDVRIIAATNRNLEEMVKNGQFREDLYYRLNVISLLIPPLRERRRDVDSLIQIIMKDLNRLLGTSITGISSLARTALLQYEWPGNVRELKNVLERAMTFAEHGKIQKEDLPDYMIYEEKIMRQPMGNLFEDAEIQAIQKALDQAKGNKAEAARLLGISRSGLYEKIKKYSLVNKSVR
ncbi:sigma-54-dependent Fis family transcriptional regulator [Peribacillus alkalitolerans]|uniref:sigma-54-dependent Fis family transcriptional regulator n=1 Tax=Peribacillus alkalitolerans TaxID=1550385 RepID=UPI0013D3016A|nr:sigma-54-dependent Fis family transcriptional regulator [Peribacillus alkalitolerans]